MATTAITPGSETTQSSGDSMDTISSGARSISEFVGEPDNDTGPEVDSELHPEPAEETQSADSGEGDTESTQATEAQTEETADDWLPTEQEKEFPLAVLQKYAPRYGYTAEEIQADPRLQNVLKDKLNSDIYINQQRQQQEEPLFEEEPASETATQQTVEQPAGDVRAQHYQRVDAVASKIDPSVTEELGRNLLSAMGVNVDPNYVKQLQGQLRNPQTTPQQRAEIQQHLDLAQNAGKIGGTLGRGAIDLVMTVLPQLMPDVLEQLYPGTRENYETSVYRDSSVAAWNELRSASVAGQKPYASLPAFGTPEFKTLMRESEAKLGLNEGELADMVFQNTNAGDRKGVVAAARKAYMMVAKIATGQQVQPQAVAQAVETGKRLANATTQKRAAGRVLGAGQGSRQGAAAVTGDNVRDNLRSAIKEIADDDNWDKRR